MTDDERAGTNPPPDRAVGDDLPAIPDGGLSEALPDWLRRPPAWRGMVVPEAGQTSDASRASSEDVPVSVEENADAAEAVAEAEAPVPVAPPQPHPHPPRVIPEPDRSPIDPATLIELSDLPAWLIGLGKREVPSHDMPDAGPPVADATVVVETPAPVTEEIVLRSQAAGREDSLPDSDAPAGKGMRALVLLGVIAVVVLVAILIAQFG